MLNGIEMLTFSVLFIPLPRHQSGTHIGRDCFAASNKTEGFATVLPSLFKLLCPAH